jgi:hypothetical protein
MKNITNKQLQRMIDLMGNKKPINENINHSSVELIKKSPKGGFYGIVKENKKYYIKESNNGVNFDFIGGIGNMTKNQYHSFEEAVRRLNLMLENTDTLTPDLIEEKKFVIKTKKKKKVKKPVEDTEEESTDFDFGTEEGGEEESTDFDFGTEEDTEEGGEEESTDFDFGDEEGGEEEEDTEEETGDEESTDFDFGDEEGGEEEVTGDENDEDLDLDSDDHIKSIQRLTGKLGQKLRDTEDLSSDTMKWVTKSIISALDLGQMDGEDKKDIIRAIKKKDEEGSDEELDFMGDSHLKRIQSLPYEDREKYMNGNIHDYELEDDYNTYDDDYIDIEELDSEYNDYMDEEGPLGGDEDYPIYDRKRGGELLLDDDDYLNEPHNDDDEDNYPGMGPDWRDYMEDYMEDPYMMPQTAPSRPKTQPSPDVKPGRPDTDRPSPSRRPFTPPPHITPGEEPAPKARYREMDNEDEYYGSLEGMDYMSDSVVDKMASYEQEMAYQDVEDMAIQNGMEIEFCHKDRSKDPEEQTVYLDLIKKNRVVAKIRINSVGDIEMGHMLGKVFKGEPVDSLSDFDEVLGEKGIKMNPQTAPSKPQVRPETPVKPGRPNTSPTRRPFTPPPHITPGEEPAPKARYRKIGNRYE